MNFSSFLIFQWGVSTLLKADSLLTRIIISFDNNPLAYWCLYPILTGGNKFRCGRSVLSRSQPFTYSVSASSLWWKSPGWEKFFDVVGDCVDRRQFSVIKELLILLWRLFNFYDLEDLSCGTLIQSGTRHEGPRIC